MVETIFRVADEFASSDKEVIAIKAILRTKDKELYLATCKGNNNILSNFMIKGAKKEDLLTETDVDIPTDYIIQEAAQTQTGENLIIKNGIYYRAYNVVIPES